MKPIYSLRLAIFSISICFFIFNSSAPADDSWPIVDESVVPTPTPLPTRSLSDIRRSMDEEANRIFIASAALGDPPRLVIPGDPNGNRKNDYFELPEDQRIEGCTYTKGSSFPDNCADDEDNLIFEAGRDPQSTLDKIKLSHGITGEYNVVPEGYFANPHRKRRP